MAELQTADGRRGPPHYDFVRERISLVVDLYDAEKYAGSRNYYTPKRPLTAENKLGPRVS